MAVELALAALRYLPTLPTAETCGCANHAKFAFWTLQSHLPVQSL